LEEALKRLGNVFYRWCLSPNLYSPSNSDIWTESFKETGRALFG